MLVFSFVLAFNASFTSVTTAETTHEDPNDSEYSPDEYDINDDDENWISEDSEVGGDSDDECYIVYRSQLDKLIKYCTNCGSLVDKSLIKRIDKFSGSQFGK